MIRNVKNIQTVVITGGIGSGKSEVCRILAARGVPVYDSDSRTKSLYTRKPDLVVELCKALGTDDILDASGRLDRSRLASLVFNDADAMKILESIVHPAVLEDFSEWKVREADFCNWSLTLPPFVIFESAIILEKPLFRGLADKIVLVDAPLETRIERACKRDNVSSEAVIARISSQILMNGISLGTVQPDVDCVLYNDGDRDTLQQRVSALFV